VKRFGIDLFLMLVIMGFMVAFPQTATAENWGTKEFVADGNTFTVGWGESRRFKLGPTKYAVHIYGHGKMPDGRTAEIRFASIPLDDDEIEVTIARNIVGSSDALIISGVSGSGGFLNYQVFTVKQGVLKCILDRSRIELHNGKVKVRGKSIEEYRDGRLVKIWRFN